MKGNPKIKAKDIAQELGVSPATVSLALNDKPGVNPDTKRRIRDYVNSLESGGDPAIYGGTVLLVTYAGLRRPERPENRTLFNISYVEISRMIQRARMELKLHYTYSPEELLELFDTAGRTALGLIINADEMPPEALGLLDRCPVPLVAYAGDLTGNRWDVVNFHNAKAVREGLAHLTEKGHRDIVYMMNTYTIHNFTARRRTFLDFAREHSWDPAVCMVETGQYSETVCKAAIPYLRDRPVLPDAIFAENYIVSIGLAKAIQSLGLRVPEDISVIGIDSIPESVQMPYDLTHFRVPHVARSRLVAELLLQRIRGAGDRPATELFLNIDFVAGGSVGQKQQ